MLITRQYALSLIRAGKARIDGATVDEHGEPEYVILTRHDALRVDHYPYTDADETAVEAADMAWGEAAK